MESRSGGPGLASADACAKHRYPVAEWSPRIGSLMPGGHDHWWWPRPGQELEPLAAEVIGALTDYGLPALQRAVRQAS